MHDDDRGGDPACWAHRFDDGVETVTPEQLAAVARAAGDAIVVCDRFGRITFWNDAAARLFGHPASDALGGSLDLIIPAKHRQRHWDGWRAAVERGTSGYADQLLRVPAEHADGTRISIAFTVTLVLDAAGAVEAVAAIIRDETAERRERLALEARVRELSTHAPTGSEDGVTT